MYMVPNNPQVCYWVVYLDWTFAATAATVSVSTGGQALPVEVARAVVLEAAQYFFGSASSLEAEEIGLGQVTLSLLPHDPEVQQQGLCLQALQELQDYGLHLLPGDYNQVGLSDMLCILAGRSGVPCMWCVGLATLS